MFEDPTPAEKHQLFKDIFEEIITRAKGCKGEDLVNRPDMAVNNITKYPADKIRELVEEGRLVEIKYLLPDATSWKDAKSFLLPAGTKIKISGFIE